MLKRLIDLNGTQLIRDGMLVDGIELSETTGFMSHSDAITHKMYYAQKCELTPCVVLPYTNKHEPEFDGFYLCVIERDNECGTIGRLYRVTQYSFAKWLIGDNERVLTWATLPTIELYYDAD